MNLTNLKQKIILGTVQLGLPYGINNTSGKPDEFEAHCILDKAASEGILLLDSAEAYGDSLNVIGSWSRKNKSASFRVISKFIGGMDPLLENVIRTLSVLGQPALYALLYHRFSDYESGEYKTELLQLKAQGKIDRIGISLYSEEELETTLEDPDISVIQIPFHPLDGSPAKKRLLAQAKAAGKEVHVRSVFFQGLVFKSAAQLTGNLTALSQPLKHFHSIVAQNGLSVREACLNYALHQPFIDRVIVGVETSGQLEENIRSVLGQCPDWILRGLEFDIRDKNLLNPSNWKA